VSSWSFDILRQGSWDWWAWTCLAVTALLVGYTVYTRAWLGPRGRLVGVLVGVAMIGTAVVLFLPGVRTPVTGLVWTVLLFWIASGVFYVNLIPQIGPRRTGVLLVMRCVALLLLVPMLFEPVLRYVSREAPQRPLVVLIDTSGSMSLPDAQNGPTRLQSVWQALQSQMPRLRERFVPTFYQFSTTTSELKTPASLGAFTPDGPATDLVGAVGNALSVTTRDDASVLLISDGIDNVSADVVDAVRLSRRPVHTVAVGSDQAQPTSVVNVAVASVDAPDDFSVGAKATFKINVQSSSLANRVVDVKLAEVSESTGPTPTPLAQVRLVLQPLPEGQNVELTYEPRSPGVKRVAVWIEPVAGERSLADNRQEVQGLALDPRIKVLYIEGRARPEYRELNRALARDPNIEISSLLRLQADRFIASGTAGGEPVKTMPRTTEEWKKFDVIVIGDVDVSFLSPLQQEQIQQRVSEGGGLLTLGGENAFGPGGYKGSAIEKALPVYAGERSAAQEKTAFIPQLTSDGAAHPALEGLIKWFGSDDAKPTETLPALRGNVVVSGAKEGASVLLVHAGRPGPDGRSQVILAVQRFGTGRSAAFTADTTYLWYLPLRGMGQDSPYNRFWGQLVRWLANADVKNRDRGAGVEGLLGKTVYRLGESVHVRAMVRDVKGDATRFAQTQLNLRKLDEPAPRLGAAPSTAPAQTQFPLTPSPTRNGLYDVQIPNLSPGEYEVTVDANKDGAKLGQSVVRFTVIPPADELLNVAANPKLLASMSDATRGFHYPLAQLPELVDALIRQDPTNLVRQRTVPLHNTLRLLLAGAGVQTDWGAKYDLPTQAFFVTSLLVGEWVLRRRWQLA